MEIQPVYSVVIRAEGSEKTLVLIDELTEAEADKVFKRIHLPYPGQGLREGFYLEGYGPAPVAAGGEIKKAP